MFYGSRHHQRRNPPAEKSRYLALIRSHLSTPGSQSYWMLQNRSNKKKAHYWDDEIRLENYGVFTPIVVNGHKCTWFCMCIYILVFLYNVLTGTLCLDESQVCIGNNYNPLYYCESAITRWRRTWMGFHRIYADLSLRAMDPNSRTNLC
jgi:hypothetical protein